MLTKQFNTILRAAITGENFTFKMVDGNIVTMTIPTDLSNNYAQYFTKYMMRIPALMNNDRYSAAIGYSSNGGVAFGTGTAAPTEDDYKITQKVMNSGTGFAVTKTVTQEGGKCTGIYTLVNDSTTDVTITEVGLFGSVMCTTNSYYCYLIDRTLLEEPVTIKAGEVGKITYTVTID